MGAFNAKGAVPTAHAHNNAHPLLHPDIFVLVSRQLSRVGAPDVRMWISTCTRAWRLRRKIASMLCRMKIEYISIVHPNALQYPNMTSLMRRLHRHPPEILLIEQIACLHGLSIPAGKRAEMWKYAVKHFPFVAFHTDDLNLWRIAVSVQPMMLIHAAKKPACRAAWAELSYIASRVHEPRDTFLTQYAPGGDEFNGMIACKKTAARQKLFFIGCCMGAGLGLCIREGPNGPTIVEVCMLAITSYTIAYALSQCMQEEIQPPPMP